MVGTLPLSEFVEINPKVKLKKGVEYPFVEMGFVVPGNRYVSSDNKRSYKGGGAKFRTGDTLFARITPCLENGKIVQFSGASNEVGFGSTEFFVFRNKEGISDAGYVFYLASSSIIRKPAEKSMFGTSGRQRADLASIKDMDIPAPTLPTQRKIAAILGAYDDLIENNTRRIRILEEMAQALYREWFVKFRFPGHENVEMVESELGLVPEGWEVKRLGDVIELAYGKALKAENRIDGPVPVYGSGGIVGHHDESLAEGPSIIVGRKGNVGSVYWSDDDFFAIDTVFYVKSKVSLPYIYYNLRSQNFINNDAAVPGLNRNQAYLLPFLLPNVEILSKFENFVNEIFKHTKNLRIKNANLRRTRDLLLPKLISGELDVNELHIEGMP